MKTLILFLLLLPGLAQAFSLTRYISKEGIKLNSTKIGKSHFVNSLNSTIILPNNAFVFDFLRNGGSNDLAVNGSVTAQSFRYTPPTGFSFLLKDVNFVISSANNTNDKFGGIIALTNGITYKIFDKDDNLLNDFLGGATIKKNSDFNLLASSSQVLSDVVAVNFNILNTGASIAIPPGGYVEVLVQDDLTGLTQFRVSVNGLLMPGEIEFAE